jgi:hypothetical protein
VKKGGDNYLNSAKKRIGTSLLYDLVLAILYTWSIYQAYVFDAKTLTGEIWIYVLVYVLFTCLVRSPIGVVIMNLLSVISLFFIFNLPIFQAHITYFAFDPYLGIAITIFIALIQALIANLIILWSEKFLFRKYQFIISGIIAVVFTTIFTIVCSAI